MKKIHFVWLVVFCSCSGDGSYIDVQGKLKSSAPASLIIPDSPTPVVSVMGHDPTEFEVEFVSETLGQPQADFVIHQLPTKEPTVFQITHTTFDPVISFPIDLKTATSLTLPALESGTTTLIIDGMNTILGGNTVDATAGMILGQIKSAGGGCSPLNSVQIKDINTNLPVAGVAGPMYFNTTGNVVNSGNFSDSQCSYVIANLLAGNYVLEYLDDGLQVVSTYEVVVLLGSVTFGMDLPQ